MSIDSCAVKILITMRDFQLEPSLCVVSAPKGTKITGQVTDVGDGSYNVEYTPTDIGNF